MKKLILLVACIVSALTVNAQTRVTWTAELGLGMSTWMGDGSDNADPLFNQRVGVGIDVPLSGMVSFKTGLNWTSKGAKHKVEGNTLKVNQNYFQMPLLAALHLGTASSFDLVLSAGPYIAYGVKGKNNLEVDDVTTSWDTFGDSKINGATIEGFRRFDAGIQAGVAFDFSRWTVGLQSEFGLCRVHEDGPRNLGLFIGAGYKF